MPLCAESPRHVEGCPLWGFRSAAWLALSLAVAVAVGLWRMEGGSVYEGARLTWLVSGEGHLPYQHRVLVPYVAGALQKLGLGTALQPVFSPLALDQVATALDTPPDLAAIFLLIEIGSLWGMLLAFRALAARCGSGEAASRIGALVLAALLLLPQFLSPTERLWYPSDVPAVLVVVLGYLALFCARPRLFDVVFLLGCLNRETSLFLLPVLLLLPSQVSGSKRPVIHAAALALAWAAIKAGIFFAFRGNHGYPIHPNIFLNIEILSSTRGALVSVAVATVCAAVVVAVIRRGADVKVQAALKASVLLLGATLFAGKLDEFRVYSELAPVAVLVGLAAAQTRSGVLAAAKQSPVA